LKKGNNSLAASIPPLPGGALKGGGKNRDTSSALHTMLFAYKWKCNLEIQEK